MFAEERHAEIEKILKKEGKVKVKELSNIFSVTDDCIRKDLKVLENDGKLRRTYGGAILSKDYPLQREVVDRKMYHVDQKERIAKKAFEYIKENETIFLDISTTNILLARLLAESNKKILVVSNMIDILQTLVKNPLITAVGTGGTMHSKVNGFMGALTIEYIGDYSFDKAFLGTCGIDIRDSTFTTLGAEDGLTKKAIINNSRHKYVMIENEKFYFNESYKYAHFDDINGIFTDKKPEKSIENLFLASDVQIYHL